MNKDLQKRLDELVHVIKSGYPEKVDEKIDAVLAAGGTDEDLKLAIEECEIDAEVERNIQREIDQIRSERYGDDLETDSDW